MSAREHLKAYKALDDKGKAAYNHAAPFLLQAMQRRALLERFPERGDNSLTPGKATVWYLARFSAKGGLFPCQRYGKLLIIHYGNSIIGFVKRSRALTLERR